MKGITKHILIIICLMLVLPALVISDAKAAATKENYCLIPPYVTRNISANIFIFLDNSEVMYNAAYGHDDTYIDMALPVPAPYAPNASYDNYFGYYLPDGCYQPSMIKVSDTDYGAFPTTGCAPGLFSGNILNWATASRLLIMKKVIMGGLMNPRPDSPNTLSPEGVGDWTTRHGNCVFETLGGDELTVSDKSALELCTDYPTGNWKNIAITITDEPVTGVFQQFTDEYDNNTLLPPRDNDYDWNVTRFGFAAFTNNADFNMVSTIPPGNFNSYMTSVQNLTDSRPSELSNGVVGVIQYFDTEDTTQNFEDPYVTCEGGWEDPCPNTRQNFTPCRQSFLLVLTDGFAVGGADFQADTINWNTELHPYPAACDPMEARPIVRNACFANNTDLRDEYQDDTGTMQPLPGKQNLPVYIVHANFDGPTFTDCNTAVGNAKALCDAAEVGGGQYYSSEPQKMAETLERAISSIIKRAASGTAASVLASGEGSGANLVQAVFYPRREFEDKVEIDWTGRLSNFWYYIDPFFALSTIREDTPNAFGVQDYTLNLKNDYIVQFIYNPAEEQTEAIRCQDTDGDGGCNTPLPPPNIAFEQLGTLWNAGLLLWHRDYRSRTIMTTVDGQNLIDFSLANGGALRDYLALPNADLDGDLRLDGDLNGDLVVDNTDLAILIEYVQGRDFPALDIRNRTVKVDINDDGDTNDIIPYGDVPVNIDEGPKVWKLGDILNSTPRIATWAPPNNYQIVYRDSTYGNPGAYTFLSDPADPTHYITSAVYKDRGMVFAGANDGMLHAFKLGRLEQKWAGQTSFEKARLVNTNPLDPATPSLGDEEWTFIPRNVLPYLRYLTDPDYGDCHIFSVDLTPFIFDASICAKGSCAGNYWTQVKDVASWRTILIGGMRFGGACRQNCGASTDCVETPITDPADPAKGLGYSSYFAIDITDQQNPVLLWEFSDDALGFTTAGASIVRIGDPTQNGKWLAVLASGPTGGITQNDLQFLGNSDQSLKLFVLDLKDGTHLHTIDTGIPNAFAGSMLNATNDSDQNYSDDAIYIPYVAEDVLTGTWIDGGVVRLVTKENIDPTTWVASRVIRGTGPVTSAIQRLQNEKKKELWLFFGAGRYFYERPIGVDDEDGQRQVYGIKEPCFNNDPVGFPDTIDPACSTELVLCADLTVSVGSPPLCGDLNDMSDLTIFGAVPTPDNPLETPDLIQHGWYINLDPSVAGQFHSERIITDPVGTTSGLVFFTSFKPYDDVCLIGGKSFIWALRYNTGGGGGSLLTGKALVQVSTGEIQQVDLKSAFIDRDSRRTAAIEGVPPTAQGLSLLVTPPPVKRILHMQER